MGVDRLILAFARRQHGLVAARQIVAAGVSRDALRHRVSTGWLRRRHRGVYLVGPLETPHTAAMAAVLAYGEGALLSHYPAAVLWGLRPAPAHTMHVTVVASGLTSRDGIGAHRTRHLHPADATRQHGIPVTSPARTLLDLAATASAKTLARATDEARIHRLVTDGSLNEQFERYPAHRGIRALTHAIETEPRLTRSEAERRLLELIRAARLPDPQTNVLVDRYEVDFLWPEHHLVVEVDGYAFHSMRRSFERDRRRDARLTAMGYRATRVTWRQITDEPEAVIATLAAQLAAPSPLVRSSTVSA
jgi:very-short-patch-repair endonuclease